MVQLQEIRHPWLVVEDRLTSHSARYAAVDRVPQLAFSSATHSRNLFMPIDPGEYANLPVTDYFINGIHFVFTTANVATKYFVSPQNPAGVIFRRQSNHPDVDFVNVVDWIPTLYVSTLSMVSIIPDLI